MNGKERLALERSLALAQELGQLDAPAEQVVDSTPMLGAAATQDTVRLVRSGVRKLIDAVRATDEDSARRLDDGLCFDYARPAEKPDCRWREKAERERMLTRVAEDAERALRAVEQTEGLLSLGRPGAWRVQVARPERRVLPGEPMDQGRRLHPLPARVEAVEGAPPRPCRRRARFGQLKNEWPLLPSACEGSSGSGFTPT